MASGPDLFVVCKSCGSEVSPYITECPYCGTRLRKRAPKLERGGVPKARSRRAGRVRACRRCAAARSPASGPTGGPYATIALVVVSVVVSLLGARRLGPDRRPRARRPARRRLVAAGHDPVRLRQHRLRGRRARAPSPLRLAARAPARLVGAAARLPRRRHARDAARRRPSTSAASALGGNAAALALLAAWAMRDVLGAARAAARTTPTCSARWPSPCCSSCSRSRPSEAHALAGLGGGVAGHRARARPRPPAPSADGRAPRLLRRRDRGGGRGAVRARPARRGPAHGRRERAAASSGSSTRRCRRPTGSAPPTRPPCSRRPASPTSTSAWRPCSA